MLEKLKKTLNELEDFTSFYEMIEKYPIGTKFKVGATMEAEILPGGIFEHGGEGGSEHAEVYIQCGFRYFAVPASYSSYGDSEIYPDDTFEVQKREVIETRYFKLKEKLPENIRLYTPIEEDSYSYNDNSYD